MEMYFLFDKDHYFYIRLGCGYCTNTRGELLALWGLLFVADALGLPELSVLWGFKDNH